MTCQLAHDANGGPVLLTARLRMPSFDDIPASFRFSHGGAA
jgi:hypothetical protein